MAKISELFSGAWHTFEREMGVAPILLFPIKGQERWRRVQLVQFHPVNSLFTPPGLCTSPGGRPELGKLGLAIGNQTTTGLCIPSAGGRCGVPPVLLTMGNSYGCF